MAERPSLAVTLAAWANVLSSLVAAVAAMVAGYIGYYTYQLSEQQSKTAQTLAFAETFNSPSMVYLREKISNEDWCVRYGYVSSPTYEPMLTTAEVMAFVDFFDSVRACTEAGMCNHTFAAQLFGSAAENFYDDLSPSIVEARTNGGERSAQLGLGMAALAGNGAPLDDVATRYATRSCGLAMPTP